MSRRTPETLADYLVVAICPALIMVLIGSLMFFLVEVFYQGQYELRLIFILAMFVMAIVCLARISMEEGYSYASMYAVPFGILYGIALARFVQFGGPLAPFSLPINFALMAWVWWCAHKLTWDSTLIDDSSDASGAGLLQQMGLDREPSATGSASGAAAAEATTANLPTEEPKQWWQKWLEPDRRPHPPGVWVVYFSLGALPIFGIGGRFIQVDDLDSRRWCFWLLVLYVASAMALLLATSFLGLRKYLRQRKLEMPLEMAAAWVGVGVLLIVGTIIVAALVPRPAPEYSLAHVVKIDSPELWASRIGFGPEGGKSNPDNPSSSGAPPTKDQQADQQGPGKSDPNQRDGPSGDGGKGKGSGKGDGKGQGQGDKSQSNQSQAGQSQPDKSQQSQNSNDQSQQQARDSQEPSQNGDKSEQGESDRSQSKPGDKQPEKQQQGEQQQGEQSSQSSPGDGQNKQPESQNQPNNQQSSDQQSSGGSSATGSPTGQWSQNISRLLGNFGTLLKLVFYLAIAIVAAVLAWRYRVELLAAWRKILAELAALWPGLFGPKEAAAADLPMNAPSPLRPFAEFTDPFASGQAARMSPAEVVRYSFAALEAWGRENGCPRNIGQTPHEFAAAIGQLDHTLAREAVQLADLYARLAYAQPTAIRTSFDPLRALWQKMCSPAMVVAGV